MISILREKYDYIIIDTPPLGSVIDSAVVARAIDGAIIVIEANAISYRFAQGVKEQLEKANCRILGTVINKVPMDKKKYYGRYYGKYYGSYYGTYGE
jgi:capsular exopolysaccharide synthesis family protein